MAEQRDLIIIGAGPAGYIGAIRAAQLGLSVSVVEKSEVGGTCLNLGCIPTKTLLSYSDSIYALKNPKKGISVDSFNINLQEVYAYKTEVVEKLKTGITGLFKSCGVELIKGQASFVSKNELTVNGQIYSFKKAIIATGSKPVIPPSLYVEGFTIDSDYISNNPIKGNAVIIGGGVIGVEYAFILSSFGCDVTIVEKEPGLLPMEDRDCVRYVEMSLKKRILKIFVVLPWKV